MRRLALRPDPPRRDPLVPARELVLRRLAKDDGVEGRVPRGGGKGFHPVAVGLFADDVQEHDVFGADGGVGGEEGGEGGDLRDDRGFGVDGAAPADEGRGGDGEGGGGDVVGDVGGDDVEVGGEEDARAPAGGGGVAGPGENIVAREGGVVDVGARREELEGGGEAEGGEVRGEEGGDGGFGAGAGGRGDFDEGLVEGEEGVAVGGRGVIVGGGFGGGGERSWLFLLVVGIDEMRRGRGEGAAQQQEGAGRLHGDGDVRRRD